MDAIITDIHGNLEALDAVLHAIRDTAAVRVICLGDLVCYGPDSLECVRRAADWDIVLLGDWDAAILEHDPNQWSSPLNRHIECVREEFRNASDSHQLLNTLRSFKNNYIESGIHFAHGTPNDNREWTFPEDSFDTTKLNRIAAQFERVCVCGHAHINGIYRRNSDSNWKFIQPESVTRYDLSVGEKNIVTVGSVGQPRDEDPRASFALLEGNSISFHRVAYDLATTASKIFAHPNIDNMYGERLTYGR